MPAARDDLLQQIQRKLADDAVNGFLFQYPRLDVWNAHLHGHGFDNVLGAVDLSRAHYFDAAARGMTPDATARLGAGADPAAGIGSAAGALFAGALILLLADRAALRRRIPGAGAWACCWRRLLAATAIVFIIVQVVPGDPVRYMMGLQADPDTRGGDAPSAGLGCRAPAALRSVDRRAAARRLRHELHLPHSGRRAARRAPASLVAAGRCTRCCFQRVIAFPAGLYCSGATWPARRCAASSGLTQLGLAIPNFWLGMLLVLVFAVGLHWVSAGGFPGWEAGLWAAREGADAAGDCARHAAGGHPRAGTARRAHRHACTRTTSARRARRAQASGGCCGAMRCPMPWCRC